MSTEEEKWEQEKSAALRKSREIYVPTISEKLARLLAEKHEIRYKNEVQTEALINHLKRLCPNITDEQIIEFFDDVIDSYMVE